MTAKNNLLVFLYYEFRVPALTAFASISSLIYARSATFYFQNYSRHLSNAKRNIKPAELTLNIYLLKIFVLKHKPGE